MSDALPELPGFSSDERIPQALEQLEKIARGLGLYVDQVNLGVVGDRELIAVEFLIGDLAFSDVVQNPMQEDVDQAVALMSAQMHADEGLELRARIQRALDEGRNPLELEDE